MQSKGNDKMKRQPTEWEKIFAKEATNKELISKIYQQLTQLKKTKKKTTHQKMGRRSRHSSKEDIQMTKTHMKRSSTYQRNANQNYNKVSPQTSQNGHHQKVYKQ